MPFVHDGMRGIADFLERVEDEHGRVTYEPVDAKLARVEAKPGHVLQLSFYADAIEAALGVLPEHLHVWLGSGTARDRPHPRGPRLLAPAARPAGRGDRPRADGDTAPVPCSHCDYCQFAGLCEQQWREADALHYVAGIRTADREVLVEGGTSPRWPTSPP